MNPIDNVDRDEVKKMAKKQKLQDEVSAMDVEGSPYGGDFFNYFTSLIEVYNVPKHIKVSLWGLTNRVHQITNFNDKDIRMMMRDFDNVVTRWRMSIPEWEYTYELDAAFKQLETLFYSMVKRSSQGGFERRMQATQIRQVEASYGENKERKGITGKISRLFGGR